LELLGKRKGVQLFTDQVEVTVKQKPIEEIEKELGSLLERYMGPVEQVIKNDVQDVEVNEVIDLENIDLDAELGLNKAKDDGTEPAGTDKTES
jgi:hypothetical protein